MDGFESYDGDIVEKIADEAFLRWCRDRSSFKSNEQEFEINNHKSHSQTIVWKHAEYLRPSPGCSGQSRTITY